jgi:acetyltransferase-like isoleucine patch superfamily enzyme
MRKFTRILFFKFKINIIYSWINTVYLKLLGLETKSILPYSTNVTWPHKLSIGKKTLIENSVSFKYDGPYSENKSILVGDNVFIGANCEFNIKKKIVIKNDTLIASGCKFIDHDHGIAKDCLFRLNEGYSDEIIIAQNVWIGANSIILKGVTISQGAVVAAGAVVNTNIPENEIWGGVPAKKIKSI